MLLELPGRDGHHKIYVDNAQRDGHISFFTTTEPVPFERPDDEAIVAAPWTHLPQQVAYELAQAILYAALEADRPGTLDRLERMWGRIDAEAEVHAFGQ